MTITPGLYPNMPFDEYLAADALSMSAISTLIDSFPARLLHKTETTPAMRLGRIMHSTTLEDEDFISLGLVVVPKGWNDSHVKKNAEEYPEIVAAIETGAEKLKHDEAEQIRGMHAALKSDEHLRDVFSNGQPEVSAFWTDERFGVLCKALFDWWPNKGRFLPDLKTCECVDPDKLSRSIANYKMAHRSNWYERAARHLGMVDPMYLPVWVEKKTPHFCVAQPVEPLDVEMVDDEINKALATYARCKESDHWPGPQHMAKVELPGYERRRLEWKYGAERAENFQGTDDW